MVDAQPRRRCVVAQAETEPLQGLSPWSDLCTQVGRYATNPGLQVATPSPLIRHIFHQFRQDQFTGTAGPLRQAAKRGRSRVLTWPSRFRSNASHPGVMAAL